MVGASLFGAVPLALGVAAHEGSTVLVVLNSLRLLLSEAGCMPKPHAGARVRESAIAKRIPSLSL